jgi:streptogramin lyase
MPPPGDGEGRRRALIVATGTYGDATLAGLRAPGRDAAELAAILQDAAIGGFDVETVLDVPADGLRRRVARFCSQGGPGDLALVYISCHGVLDDRGRLYYATTDTDHELLAATAIPAAWLNEQLDDCRCRRQIVILDCCHSGAFAKGAKGEGALALRERFEGRGRVVLTASRATEYSFEGDRVLGDGVSSVFTDVLVQGLRSGDADRDGDGMVTVTELYDYAYELVRSRDARQTPMLWTYGAEGGLLVAHSARGVVSEPPPPPATPPRARPAEPLAPPPRRLPSRRALAAAGALVAALMVVGLVALLPDSSDSSNEPTVPRSGSFSMDGSPRGIAAGGNTMWIARHEADTVSWIGTDSELASVSVDPGPETIAADDEGTAWATTGGGTALERIDAETYNTTRVRNVLTRQTGCGCPSADLVIAFSALWVGMPQDRAIAKRDLLTGKLQDTRVLPVGFEGRFAASIPDDGVLWAVGTPDDRNGPAWVKRVDFQQTGVETYQLEDVAHPSGVAFGAGAVWITDDRRNTVVRFDPQSHRVSEPIEITDGVSSDDIVAGPDAVLVWNPSEGKLTRIDPNTRRVKVIDIQNYRTEQPRNILSSELAAANGVAWMTDPAANRVLRVRY